MSMLTSQLKKNAEKSTEDTDSKGKTLQDNKRINQQL